MTAVRVLDHEALVAASGGSPWVRWALEPDPLAPSWQDLGTGAGTGAVAVVRPPRAYAAALTAVGPAAAAADLALELLREGAVAVGEPPGDAAPGASAPNAGATAGATAPQVAALTLPRTDPAVVQRVGVEQGLGQGIGWDWMWTDRAPEPVPGEDAVRDLDVDEPAVAAEVLALLVAASPRHSAEPGTPQGTHWVGIRGAGSELVACGAHGPEGPGIPLLASVAVDAAARGRGLGAAVTAALTRRALAEGAPVVTVDLYADNPVALRLYLRLGFTLDQQFSSWHLPPGWSPATLGGLRAR